MPGIAIAFWNIALAAAVAGVSVSIPVGMAAAALFVFSGMPVFSSVADPAHVRSPLWRRTALCAS